MAELSDRMEVTVSADAEELCLTLRGRLDPTAPAILAAAASVAEAEHLRLVVDTSHVRSG